MDAFDADVLIYAAVPGHPLGRRVAALFPTGPVTHSGAVAGIGSVLLVPEILSKPLRDGARDDLESLAALLARLDLRSLDLATASLAAELGAIHGLHAADSIHLATAVIAGADRFLTNNQTDFSKAISEVDVVYPSDLPDPV
jgi:predicted nucleic acid-binding protein